jgi:hypothetical protein
VTTLVLPRPISQPTNDARERQLRSGLKWRETRVGGTPAHGGPSDATPMPAPTSLRSRMSSSARDRRAQMYFPGSAQPSELAADREVHRREELGDPHKAAGRHVRKQRKASKTEQPPRWPTKLRKTFKRGG